MLISHRGSPQKSDLLLNTVMPQPRENFAKFRGRNFRKRVRLLTQNLLQECKKLAWRVIIQIFIFVRKNQRQILQGRFTEKLRVYWKDLKKRKQGGKREKRESLRNCVSRWNCADFQRKITIKSEGKIRKENYQKSRGKILKDWKNPRKITNIESHYMSKWIISHWL